MKRLIFVCGVLASGFSFGADWVYITSSKSETFYIDKAFYNYNARNKTIDVWSKSVKNMGYGNEPYTSSKSLKKYSCSNKSSKYLAYVEYYENGSVLRSISTPNKNFSVIFPDTIEEAIWKAACSSNGKGFKFTKTQLSIQEDLYKPYEPEYVPKELMPVSQ